MSNRYAVIENGKVVNLILWDGVSEWTPPQGMIAVALEDDSPADIGDSYVDGEFIIPPPPKPPVPTVEQVLANRDLYLLRATLRIGPLQGALDLGEAGDDGEAVLLSWKRYLIDVSRIDQQPGFPEAVEWPAPPQ